MQALFCYNSVFYFYYVIVKIWRRIYSRFIRIYLSATEKNEYLPGASTSLSVRLLHAQRITILNNADYLFYAELWSLNPLII